MPDQFQPTRWSLIHEAVATDAEQRNRAWSEFDAIYREPLLRFVRRTGRSAEQAEDLLQGFFAKLAKRNWLAEADRDRGKMRTFLLSRLKGHLNDARKYEGAEKRGGGAELISSDTFEINVSAEDRDIDRLFDRDWAQAILDRTLSGLKQEAREKGRIAAFDLLKNQITGDSIERLSEAATKLGQSEGAVRMQLQRLREKFRNRLRAEVAETLLPGENVSAEMRYLAEVLANS